MNSVATIFGLLIAFQVKHFLADYPLQNEYMLGKFKADWNFIPHLTAHASVHAVLTFIIIWLCGETPGKFVLLAAQLAALDFVIHFLMDRVKASPTYLGRYKALSAKDFAGATETQKWHNKFFWWALGFDQMVHHLTHYAIIYFMVSHA